MIYILTILLCPIACYGFSTYLAQKEKRYFRLLDVWKDTFTQRSEWIQRYECLLPNARMHSDYLELWDCEIGAETLLVIYCGCRATSYEAFLAERQMLQAHKQ